MRKRTKLNEGVKECRTCKTISKFFGKKYMMPLLGHHYPLCRLADVQKDMKGLDLELVGGLPKRGWTTNDVDVVGNRSDAPELEQRLRADNIQEPLHWCGDGIHHSHVRCAYFGIKMALTGKGY